MHIKYRPYHLTELKKRGKTGAGRQRYQCKDCGTTFTDSNGSRKQRRSEINRLLFDLLMGKMPLRQIARVLRIDPKTLYRKIDFLHQQCLNYAAANERRILEGRPKIDRLYLATDRQAHISNWVSRYDKRNTEIYGIGTACLTSGYVFAFNFNFDQSLKQEDVELEAKQNGDLNRPKHHRKHARIWLNHEYAEAAKGKYDREQDKKYKADSIVGQVVEETMLQAKENRSLSSEHIDEDTKLPRNGVLIHNEYTMLGHFFFLKSLFKHCDKTRFYMDLDSGLYNAYISAFKDEIKSGVSDGFLVKAAKDKNSHQKEQYRREALRLYKKVTGVSYRNLSPQERKQVEIQLIKEAMQHLTVIKSSTLQWLTYPIATMPEPEKMVAAVTNIKRLDEDHQAHLYRKSSLHAIDRFFMKLRRYSHLFERPIKTPSSSNRVWYGYSPYNLAMYTKVGDIARVYYNYCDSNDDGETPAMRLGLAKGPVKIEKIIYFGKYD